MPLNSQRRHRALVHLIQIVHTSNLKVGQFIVLAGVLEAPQPKQIHIELIWSALQLANLQSRVNRGNSQAGKSQDGNYRLCRVLAAR